MNWRSCVAAALVCGVALGLGAGCGRGSRDKPKPNEGNKEEVQPKEAPPKEGQPKEGKPNEKTKDGTGGAKDTSFTLVNPDRVELKAGGSKTFQIAINRGVGFTSEVKFSLQPPRGAKGITFTPADWQLDSNDSSMTVTAKAAPDASTGSFTWTLIVRPRVGKTTTHTLTVVVSP